MVENIGVSRDADGANFVPTASVSSGGHSANGLAPLRFTLNLRDVEEMVALRGVGVSYETVRAWTVKFGPRIAANLRRKKSTADTSPAS